MARVSKGDGAKRWRVVRVNVYQRVIPAKAGIQCLSASKSKVAGFLLSQE
jgi:hypothetical protein